MPKYWGKQIFSHGCFPKVGQKQKTEKERKKERLKVGNKNGQLRIAMAIFQGHACKNAPKPCKTGVLLNELAFWLIRP